MFMYFGFGSVFISEHTQQFLWLNIREDIEPPRIKEILQAFLGFLVGIPQSLSVVIRGGAYNCIG
jgi:hypothetical protein